MASPCGFVQNAATQLAVQTGLGGGIGVGFKAVGGLLSSAAKEVVSDEASSVTNKAVDTALPRVDGCFVAGTLVLTTAGREPIEQVALGRRMVVGPGEPVVTGPPRDAAAHRVVRLLYVKPISGQRIELSLLRHASRVEHLGAGDTVRLDVLELEVDGTATVLGIDPAPPIEAGPGRLVTGTIRTSHNDVRSLKLAGLDEPIGVTANHPLFSEEEQRFVPVSTLRRGDRLRTWSGTPAVVDSLTAAGTAEVFNLEVEGTHLYYMSDREVLAHNACAPDYLTRSGGRLGGRATRALNDQIATSLEDAGATIEDGGGRLAEEHIPGPDPENPNLGGTFVDITGKLGSAIIRIQTVTTLADGSLIASEAAAVQRIITAFPNDILITIPKVVRL